MPYTLIKAADKRDALRAEYWGQIVARAEVLGVDPNVLHQELCKKEKELILRWFAVTISVGALVTLGWFLRY